MNERSKYASAWTPERHARHREMKTVHGESSRVGPKTPEYRVWMKIRNLTRKGGVEYNGREMDPRWNDYLTFLADIGRRPEGMSFALRDYNGNYEPENVEWVPYREMRRRIGRWLYETGRIAIGGGSV